MKEITKKFLRTKTQIGERLNARNYYKFKNSREE